LIFQKKYKSKSCLHDVLAYENGDETISVGALDIDGNRCETSEDLARTMSGTNKTSTYCLNKEKMFLNNSSSGRYPAQTFLTGTEGILDAQSGETEQGYRKNPSTNKTNWFGSDSHIEGERGYSDTGGSSKILHKCNYESGDYDILNYCPKVSPSERNLGLEEKWNLFEQREGFEEKEKRQGDGGLTPNINPSSITKNGHPCLKPIKLIEKILRLFKTPNEQKIYFPFAGSGSEIIGGIKAGFKDWEATEINQEYINIAKARIEHWTQQKQLF